jgi:hypothetical protein
MWLHYASVALLFSEYFIRALMKFAIIAAAAARYSTIVVFGIGVILGAFLAMHAPAAATTAAYAQSTTTTTATTANGSTGPADFNIAAVGD